MVTCYHDEVQFSDPVFGELDHQHACAMWHMLIERGGKDLAITFGDVQADDSEGTATWEAIYLFSKSGRKVHNKIKATFQFKDGKIIRHTDYFSFWKWSRMALGTPGALLGWSPFLKKKVSAETLRVLKKYMAQNKAI